MRYTAMSMQLSKDIWLTLKLASKKFIDDRCIMAAQALTYTTIFTLIPALSLSFSLFHFFFGDLTYLEPLLFRYLSEILAPGRQKIVFETIENLIQKTQEAPLGMFSFLFFFLIAVMLVIELEDILNHIWKVKSRKPFWRKGIVYLTALTFVPMLIAMPVIARAFLASHELALLVLKYLHIFKLLRLAPLFSIWIFLWCIYFFIPDTKVESQAAVAGALSGGILWLAAAKLYSIYTRKVFIYSILYGSIGAIPVFLLWLLISWMAILFGAEVSYSFSFRRSRTLPAA
ncbi:MAG: YihY/virulence factor BrkB family protein [Dissulfurimicrobium sp.]|uniref:YihY/virulence factor BrkB family protein n=1 Tax=Dissulfurimicrobium TaxID=1769732 RepID=UPI001EDC2197|nr:YihY/virulence factor BrkB family protein [Dissulfurimicrobium hydrothermale]UKL13077.1 YihY/virulence factor BrkB family protein [Dissulfurimicrobium hydrothermale]